ncbi:MAG: PD-(D/E)XK nuclease domain-containing protein, partial [Bryobacterales bacterium]|nr:PD-(D/E)XK nuclease domain-containing protein [Bryobacterales bacterium]
AVTVEDSSSGGRLDMAVRSGGRVYLFEFKLAGKPGAALAQLKGRGYADKYRHLGEPIHLIGVEFDPQTRAVSDFETELVPAAT